MKKLFVILVTVIGFCISANAQTSGQCKISGSDNSTFSASIGSFDYETGTVEVYAQNDSEKTVTGTVSVTWGSATKTVTIIVAAQSEARPKTVKFSASEARYAENDNHKPLIKVSSAKCN